MKLKEFFTKPCVLIIVSAILSALPLTFSQLFFISWVSFIPLFYIVINRSSDKFRFALGRGFLFGFIYHFTYFIGGVMSLLLKILLFPFKLIAAIAMCAVGAVIMAVAGIISLLSIIVTMVFSKLIWLIVLMLISMLIVKFSVGIETDHELKMTIIEVALVIVLLLITIFAPEILKKISITLMKAGTELHCLAISLVFGV